MGSFWAAFAAFATSCTDPILPPLRIMSFNLLFWSAMLMRIFRTARGSRRLSFFHLAHFHQSWRTRPRPLIQTQARPSSASPRRLMRRSRTLPIRPCLVLNNRSHCRSPAGRRRLQKHRKASPASGGCRGTHRRRRSGAAAHGVSRWALGAAALIAYKGSLRRGVRLGGLPRACPCAAASARAPGRANSSRRSQGRR